jgi:hypothetical protein
MQDIFPIEVARSSPGLGPWDAPGVGFRNLKQRFPLLLSFVPGGGATRGLANDEYGAAYKAARSDNKMGRKRT